MVEISIARYEQLLAAERDAAILKKLIAYKNEHFLKIEHPELILLDELFGASKEAE